MKVAFTEAQHPLVEHVCSKTPDSSFEPRIQHSIGQVSSIKARHIGLLCKICFQQTLIIRSRANIAYIHPKPPTSKLLAVYQSCKYKRDEHKTQCGADRYASNGTFGSSNSRQKTLSTNISME